MNDLTKMEIAFIVFCIIVVLFIFFSCTGIIHCNMAIDDDTVTSIAIINQQTSQQIMMNSILL